MSSYDESRENYSVCIAFATYRPDGRRLYKWHRIADYHPSAGQSLWPSLVEDDFPDYSEKRAHPDHLYNPSAVEGFDERSTDFYVFEWRPNPQDLSKTLSRQLDPASVFPRGCEPKEVIVPSNVNGQASLRKALVSGIPFEGKTSRTFYIVFDDQGTNCLAVRCNAKDFIFTESLIRLQPKASDFRTGLSAPIVLLKQSDIIEARHNDVMGRRIYSDMGELPERSRFLLRPLSEYAPEYVGWFAKQEQRGLSRTDRQKLTVVVEDALKRPMMLEKYADANVTDDEVSDFLRAIVAYAKQEDDPVRKSIRDEMLKDDEFAELCREEVLRQSTEEVAEKKRELETVGLEVERKQEELASAEEKVKHAWDEYEAIVEDVEKQSASLDKLASQREELLGEYETNIALRLGLRAAASGNQTSQKLQAGVVVERGDQVAEVGQVPSLDKAMVRNMSSLGIRVCPGVPKDLLKQFASSILAACCATRFLAIPSPLAYSVADALSIARFGTRATRAYVPTDSHDVEELAVLLEEDGVVVLENVIDTVNESVLFALLDRVGRAYVILPFTSHASADLLAKETWDRVFFPASESMLVVRQSSGREKLWKSDKDTGIVLDADDVLDRMSELVELLSDVSIASSSLLLPAKVLEAGEEFDGLDMSAIVQHLAIASVNEDDTLGALSSLAEGDHGLPQIALRLQRNV